MRYSALIMLAAVATTGGPAIANETCFFRIVSTQRTSIVAFDPSAQLLKWTNQITNSECRIEVSTNRYMSEWQTFGTTDGATDSNHLAAVKLHLPLRNPRSLPLTNVLHSAWGPQQPTRAIVRNSDEWAALGFPQVSADFSKEMLIVVGMGSKPNSGYNTTIQSVTLHYDRLIVRYLEAPPTPGLPVLFVITYPVHVVSVPRCDLEAVFVEQKADPLRLKPALSY